MKTESPEDNMSFGDVRFSNRPGLVKPFSGIHRCGVDLRRALSGVSLKDTPEASKR